MRVGLLSPVALRVFVLCSARRRDILLGKNLAFAPVVAALIAIVLSVVRAV